MVTKNQLKLIKSLHQKKFRKQHQLFIAEGTKVIHELLNSSLELVQIYCTGELDFKVGNHLQSKVTKEEMKKISALTTQTECLAVFRIPESKNLTFDALVLALDEVRDPGNMGTIIRLCDWFGIKHILCGEGTVDAFNPKVVQATMGSLARVNVTYADLEEVLATNSQEVIGTFMEGENIYESDLPSKGIVVMGNEANGISDSIERVIQKRISIPRFGDLQHTESLNVATATAIVLSEFKRRTLSGK